MKISEVIAINQLIGGRWALSNAAVLRLQELGHPAAIEYKPLAWNDQHDLFADYSLRTDPLLVLTVAELGGRASGAGADICLMPILDDYSIMDFRGFEIVSTWRKPKGK